METLDLLDEQQKEPRGQLSRTLEWLDIQRRLLCFGKFG